MFSVIGLLYLIALFVALTPGILLTLPPKGSKLVVAITHGIIFVLLFCMTYKTISRIERVLLSNTRMEGFTPVTDSANIVQPCQNGTSGVNGTCLTCYTGYMLNANNLCVPIIV
jgi:hypothetical protein